MYNSDISNIRDYLVSMGYQESPFKIFEGFHEFKGGEYHIMISEHKIRVMQLFQSENCRQWEEVFNFYSSFPITAQRLVLFLDTIGIADALAMATRLADQSGIKEKRILYRVREILKQSLPLINTKIKMA
jgi:hypothetical protein